MEDVGAVEMVLDLGDLGSGWDPDMDIMDAFHICTEEEQKTATEDLEEEHLAEPQPEQEEPEKTDSPLEPWYENDDNADIGIEVIDYIGIEIVEDADIVESDDLDIALGDDLDIASGDVQDIATDDDLNIIMCDDLDIASGDGLDIASGDVLDIIMCDDLDIASGDDLDIITCDDLDIASGDDLDIASGDDLDIITCDDLDIASGDGLDIASGDDLDIITCDDLDIASGDVLEIASGDDLDIITCDDLDIASGDGLDIASGNDLDIVSDVATADYLDIIVADEPDIVIDDELDVASADAEDMTEVDDGESTDSASEVDIDGSDDGHNSDSLVDVDLMELIPSSSSEEDSCLNIEEHLAILDGGVMPANEDLIDLMEMLSPGQESYQMAVIENWSVVAPLVTKGTLEVLRLCFARIDGNRYRVYDALDNVGYQPISGGTLVIHGINSKDDLPDGHQLLDDYFHIFPYTSLPEYVKQMIVDETGADVAELLNISDCMLGIDLVPDAELDIMCVGRSERLAIEFRSEMVPIEEPHSGINVFGEATRVTLTILGTEIVLDNQAILEMYRNPEGNFFFYANSNNIYLINGRTFFEKTELGKHVLPISNIDLIPFPQPHFVCEHFWKIEKY